MPGHENIIKLSFAVVLCSWSHFPSTIFGQVIFAQQSREQGDVVRVYTLLVQTDVMVFDKQGNFVNGLRRDNFELKIDGKPRPIDFFELVTAGSVSEESQLAALQKPVLHSIYDLKFTNSIPGSA